MVSVLRNLLCIALVASSYHHVPGAQAANCLVPCTKEYEPVCGSDGKTYSNKCELQCSSDLSLTLKSTGECPTTSGTSLPGPPSLSPTVNPSPSLSACNIVACPALFALVCGSDGKTYDNDCSLRFAQCTTKSLKLASQGECPDSGSGSGGSGGGGNIAKPTGSSSSPSDNVGATKKPETKSGGAMATKTAASLVIATSILFLCAFAE